MIFDVAVVNDEVWAMLARIERTLETRRFALELTRRLRQDFQRQIDEAFSSEGVPGGETWHELSQWRVESRGDSGHPILQHGGDLHSEVKSFKGQIRLVGEGFSFWFPDYPEMSGKYWGLAAGQLVNPLGATPLAAFPRRVLGGNSVNERASIESIMDYFRAEGWEVEIG